MESINITAKTLDEAITKACVELGVTSDELDYTIVETGSNGVFGFGAKPYVIKANIKAEETECEKETVISESETAAEISQEITDTKKQEKKPFKSHKNKCDKKENDAFSQKEKKHSQIVLPAEKQDEKAEVKEERERYSFTEEEIKTAGDSACEFLSSVLSKMGVEAKVEYTFEKELQELYINICGEDMGVLIGKRGQTLDALQYITGQVINKHQRNYIRVKLDTENYRERRRETLETLAENIAHKVRRTKRPVALEPMNPYERRIIHSSLQGEKDITTRSEGEEPYRHVVVCPVRRKK